MTVAETYEPISKGVIETTSSPPEVLKAFKIAEITKYVTILPINTVTPVYNVMNKDRWDFLPKDIQKVFTEVSKEAVEWDVRAWWYRSAMERIPQLGSPCWTRSSVMCGSSQLGFSPHKPIWRAFQKDPKLVEKWGKEEYPITEEAQ
jgi:hypothetical protein